MRDFISKNKDLTNEKNSLSKEIENLKSKTEKLNKDLVELRTNVLKSKEILAKFSKSKNDFEKIISVQRFPHSNAGLGYKPVKTW